MSKAQKIFLREVTQRAVESQNAISLLEADGYNREAWETLYKFAHTLKGSGQMVQLWRIAESAAEMRTVLVLIKEYDVELSEGILGFLKKKMAEILEETAGYSDSQTETPSKQPAMAGKKIMIVDDDPAVTELLEEKLKLNGFVVVICHDTYGAEQLLPVEQPDLIVLDIMFPSGDGIEFCRRIRSNSQWAIVPVIFLTVKSELQDKLAGFSTGADDYLCKPFKVEELVARIQAILNRIADCQELMLRDELTKVYNRRYLQMCLAKEIARARQMKSCFSLAIIDLDFFKDVNDRYGHLAGDEVLQYLGDQLVANLRATDVVCRYGGDEFVVVMPETKRTKAYKILERLRQSTAAKPLRLSRPPLEIPLTLSIGAVSLMQIETTGEELLKAADSALYRAKKAGRNNVRFFEE